MHEARRRADLRVTCRSLSLPDRPPGVFLAEPHLTSVGRDTLGGGLPPWETARPGGRALLR